MLHLSPPRRWHVNCQFCFVLSELSSSVHQALALIGTLYLIFAVATAALLCIATFFLGRMSVKYFQVHGPREVLCPETHCVAIFRIDALHAAGSSAVADPDLHVIGCSRWPQRQGCPQECLQGIPFSRPLAKGLRS